MQRLFDIRGTPGVEGLVQHLRALHKADAYLECEDPSGSRTRFAARELLDLVNPRPRQQWSNFFVSDAIAVIVYHRPIGASAVHATMLFPAPYYTDGKMVQDFRNNNSAQSMIDDIFVFSCVHENEHIGKSEYFIFIIQSSSNLNDV